MAGRFFSAWLGGFRPGAAFRENFLNDGSGSGVKSPQFARLQHASAGNDKSCCAKTDFMFFRGLPNGTESFSHDTYKPSIDFVFAPKEAGEVLHPLKITDCYAPSVSDHIGYDQNAAIMEDVIGFGCSRSVGALNDHTSLD